MVAVVVEGDDPATMTLTEAAIRSWGESGSGSLGGSTGASGLTFEGEDTDTMPRLLHELAESTAARLGGVEHAPVILGSYELLRVVGSGGMGQVFAARSLTSGEELALKLLNRSQPRSLRRLKQEFRVLVDVRHENLVRLDQLTVLPDGVGFFTMELIAGQPFVEHVREGLRRAQAPDPERLRAAIVQLLAAAEHLHAQGYVHRDLKPSNVLVTGPGRVVVLDFGLVHDNSGESVDDDSDRLVGTPAYMAPEQAVGIKLGPEVDVYAIGVMLFEALCGKRPFGGPLLAMLQAKREREAPDLEGMVELGEQHQELVGLCRSLLARVGSERPSAREALELLGRRAHTRTTRAARFVGRRGELGQLDTGLEWVRAHRRPALARVHGPSGQGKSALARAFAQGLGAEVVLFDGRCYEREQVPYKGFDVAVDALSKYVLELEPACRPQLSVDGLGPLARLFPVLAELWTVPPSERALPPTQLRARAFEALAELFAAVSHRQPVVVLVDDFHWGDLASVQLLEALLSTTGPMSILFILTHRNVAADPAVLRELDGLCAAFEALDAELFEIPVGPLNEEDGLALVRELTGESGHEDEGRAQALVEAAGGNPFYLSEIVRGAAPHSDDSDLDRLVARRLASLAPQTLRLLRLVALAARPIPRAVVESLDLEREGLGTLYEQDLLRDAGESRLETSHDRIREVALAALETGELSELAADLVAVLADHVGPELLAELHAQAGQLEQAILHGERAAAQAITVLAFDRGAMWLERCIAWRPNDDAERRALELQLAETLANAGRFKQGSALLLDLAEREAFDVHSLRSRAATYLLSAGWFEEGMEAAAELVAGIGLKIEQRTAFLVALVVISRFAVNRELRRFRPVAPKDLSLQSRVEIEVLHNLAIGLAGQEVLQTNYWHLRWRQAAARMGHAGEFARALTVESTIMSSISDGPRWRRLRARAHELMPADDPGAERWFLVQDMFLGVNRHHYDDVLEAATKLEPLLTGAGDFSWERSLSDQLSAWAHLQTGALRDALVSAARLHRVGREANDRRLEREGAGLHAAALVRAGELAEASRRFALLRSERKAALDGRFGFADLWGAIAWVESLLRAGQYVEARAACQHLRVNMGRNGLWRVPAYRRLCLKLAAVAELQAQLDRPRASARRRARRLTRQVRSRMSFFTGAAGMLDASQAEIDRRPELAKLHWEQAHAAYQECGCRGQMAVCDARLGRLLGGDEGAKLKRRAQAYFDEQSILDSEGFLRMFAPVPSVSGG